MRLRGSLVTLLARVVKLEPEHVSLSLVTQHPAGDCERYARHLVEWRYLIDDDLPFEYTGPTLADSPQELLHDALAGAHVKPQPDRRRLAAGDYDPDPTPPPER